MSIHAKRCATYVGGRRCKRWLRYAYTPGDWWHCWQHEQPGQTIDLWFGAHPRDLATVHHWVSENGLPMRLCDGDNTEDAPAPTHDVADGAIMCEVCQDIYLSGLDRFYPHYSDEFGQVEQEA